MGMINKIINRLCVTDDVTNIVVSGSVKKLWSEISSVFLQYEIVQLQLKQFFNK